MGVNGLISHPGAKLACNESHSWVPRKNLKTTGLRISPLPSPALWLSSLVRYLSGTWGCLAVPCGPQKDPEGQQPRLPSGNVFDPTWSACSRTGSGRSARFHPAARMRRWHKLVAARKPAKPVVKMISRLKALGPYCHPTKLQTAGCSKILNENDAQLLLFMLWYFPTSSPEKFFVLLCSSGPRVLTLTAHGVCNMLIHVCVHVFRLISYNLMRFGTFSRYVFHNQELMILPFRSRTRTVFGRWFRYFQPSNPAGCHRCHRPWPSSTVGRQMLRRR